MTKTFGKAAADHEETRGSDDEVWIRTFKEPSTRIRIIPMYGVNRHGATIEGTDVWPTEIEHYESAIGSFPCDETPSCPGCTDPDEKVQKRIRKYYFNALDEKGNVRVYKVGVKFYRVMQNREQRLGTLSDRDYFINKMGSGLDTTYELESGEKYDVPFEEVTTHDIAAILTERYQKAQRAYNGEEGAAERQDPTPREERIPIRNAATTRIQVGGGVQDTSVQDTPQDTWSEQGSAAAGHVETPPSEVPDWGAHPSSEQINAAETGVIKLWLDSMEVEYPNRAPRARIIKAAEDKAASPDF